MLRKIVDWNEFQIPYLPVIQALLPQSYNNCFELKLDNDFHTLLGLNIWKLPSSDALEANDFLFVDIAYFLNISAKNAKALFTFLRQAEMKGVKWMLYARSTPAIIDQYQLYYQIAEDEDGELPFLYIFNYGPNG